MFIKLIAIKNGLEVHLFVVQDSKSCQGNCLSPSGLKLRKQNSNLPKPKIGATLLKSTTKCSIKWNLQIRVYHLFPQHNVSTITRPIFFQIRTYVDFISTKSYINQTLPPSYTSNNPHSVFFQQKEHTTSFFTLANKNSIIQHN